MGFLTKLLGRHSSPALALAPLPSFGSFVQEIVGEASYQPAIRAIVAAHGEEFGVALLREPQNPHDPLAIAVRHAEKGLIGYLARDVAAQCNAGLLHFGGGGTCQARSFTGGSRVFGVWLDVDLKPFGLVLPWRASERTAIARPEHDPVRERFAAFSAECTTRPFDGHRIAISGVFEHWERDHLGSLITQLGGRLMTGVSKGTTVLVAGARPGPAKLRTAEEFGCRVISEDIFVLEFLEPARAEWMQRPPGDRIPPCNPLS